MKKDDFLQKLSERAGIEATKIAEIITAESDEVEGIELPEVHIFTDEELSTRLKNHVEISRNTVIEQAIKEARNNLKEKFGVTFEGKNIDNLVAASIEVGKKEAGAKPNEKIEELNKVIETLQGNINNVESEWKNKYSELENKHKTIQRNLFIKSILPTDLDTTLSHDKVVALFNMDVQVDEDNGQTIFKDANGNPYRDPKTQNPLKAEEVVTMWLDQTNIKRKNPEGRGGANEHGKPNGSLASIKSTEDFYEYCKTNNIARKDYGNVLVEVQKVLPEFRLQ
ncbi:MAG: hypothetical protein WDA42_03415 [Candidatus Bathyarchaeia archaeon]